MKRDYFSRKSSFVMTDVTIAVKKRDNVIAMNPPTGGEEAIPI